ncbi:MAG: hypothetical protein EZS28_042729 [Streblomastix strix]|uniref:Uncharacterized protein n=1 Tax=Streblomastix strix TaxID=222440 RepID=A0A5J4TU24_9EUKA|nr:MAG: hypothetical protein EZS28_042729 [Streblomastix strix]
MQIFDILEEREMQDEEDVEIQAVVGVAEHVPVVESQNTEMELDVQFDDQIAPDALIERFIMNIWINIQNEHQCRQDPSEISQKMNLLFNAVLSLRSALGLRNVEIILTAIYLVGALVFSHRYSNDIYYTNSVCEDILGLKPSTIRPWVMEILEILDFNVAVNQDENWNFTIK